MLIHTTLLLLQLVLLLQLAALPTAAGSEFIIHAVLAPTTLFSCVYAHTARAVIVYCRVFADCCLHSRPMVSPTIINRQGNPREAHGGLE